jgi:hypothetical protein
MSLLVTDTLSVGLVLPVSPLHDAACFDGATCAAGMGITSVAGIVCMVSTTAGIDITTSELSMLGIAVIGLRLRSPSSKGFPELGAAAIDAAVKSTLVRVGSNGSRHPYVRLDREVEASSTTWSWSAWLIP